MDRLPHGYTNFTRSTGGCVEKTYHGPRRWANAKRELACLDALADHMPVAAVVRRDLGIPQLTLSRLPGRNGQDLLDPASAPRVLALIGETLAALQRISPAAVPELEGEGTVIVHGDFGPQNMLFDLDSERVTGVVDWELAHVGRPIEDLAWAEWIVRMHHPDAVNGLDALFAGAGQRPPWPDRQAAMLGQIRDLLAYCESAGMDRSAADWRERLARTRSWAE